MANSKNKRHRIFLVIIILTLIAAGGSMALSRWAAHNDDEEINTGSSTAHNDPPVNSDEFFTETWDLYDDPSLIRFNYPGDILTISNLQATLPLFDSLKTGKSVIAAHAIDGLAHCDQSGLPERCTPSTTDFALTFTVLNSPLKPLTQSENYEGEWGAAGRYTAYVIRQGAEGEGVDSYLIALDDKRTLHINHSYIDSALSAPRNASEKFIPMAEQRTIVELIFELMEINTGTAQS